MDSEGAPTNAGSHSHAVATQEGPGGIVNLTVALLWSI